MTPEDLAAIRARDAASPAELPEDDPYWFPHADRRALLADLDEANAECARSKAEVDRLAAELSMSPMADDLAVWADRKRILARVDGDADAMAHFFAVGFGLRALTYEQTMALERGVAGLIRDAVHAAIEDA